MVDASTGSQNLRAENISSIVSGFALQAYKLKQLCMVSSSSSWQETYFKESKAELTGGTGSNIRGIPRLANFPYAQVTYTKVSNYIEKFGISGVISWEDENTSNISVMARTMLRIGRAVAKSVDDQIESTIRTTSGTNTVTIASGNEWDSATVANRDPIFDILAAKREIAIDNYDPDNGNGFLVVSPKDYTNILRNSKVINNPTFKSADVVTNGVVGQIVGLKIIVSNSVTASGAYVVIAKEALTWKEAKPLQVVTIEDPGIKKTIRAFELGVAQVPNPEAIVIINNTQS